MTIIRFYQYPAFSSKCLWKKFDILKLIDPSISNIEIEYCFNIDVNKDIAEIDLNRLKWILSDPLSKIDNNISSESKLSQELPRIVVFEIGPRLNFSTAFSTNAVSICHAVGLTQVTRFELSVRYQITKNDESTEFLEEIKSALYDRMTECIYQEPIANFDHGIKPEPWYYIDVLGEGQQALRNANSKLGLSFDEWDLNFYTNLFTNVIKRNPTNVECFDLAQSNSEHSRHWFFKGKMIIDGKEKLESLLQMIFDTQNFSNGNNIIKFSDNSSAIKGFTVTCLKPEKIDQPSKFQSNPVDTHLIFTAETHNFPTAVSPFSGATTGTGGRIRDIQAVGRGGHTIAATAGYSVGNLHIPDYGLPWENNNWKYPFNFSKPLDILIEASNGASDYGNKFGEPVIAGFVRAFGLLDAKNERKEYIKPIMFSGGIGKLDATYSFKCKPEKEMNVIKIGGPVYRIGVGGGSASSTQVQGDNRSELDFGAVQRGDPEMEQKLNRVIRSCLENDDNPILSIHDQGAGGNGNVLKEIVDPEGAIIFTKAFKLGDSSINTLELWGAEYQESNAILCQKNQISLLQQICQRERCPIDIVGIVSGTHRIILTENDEIDDDLRADKNLEATSHPVDLDLELILGKIPQKEFDLKSEEIIVRPLVLPKNILPMVALSRVLRLPSVASKRYLTNKVDRSVTGLIAQQQCVGPMHTPVADVAVTAISYYDKVGIASAIGEQPIIGLINPAAGARMSVAESLSNLVFAPISQLEDVKCSGNWMWAAKLPGEGVGLYKACAAMCEIMKSLGIAVDGGKDSLSMAARLDDGTIVKSPGTLVISTYAPCINIAAVVTPDLKSPHLSAKGILLHIDISNGRTRLGGSALAQCFKQLGDVPPDINSPIVLKNAFKITQRLISEEKILSGHDISDGGLITCLLEMAFSGICGIQVDLSYRKTNTDAYMDVLFAEESGWILECREQEAQLIKQEFNRKAVPCFIIGETGSVGMNSEVSVNYGETEIIKCDLHTLYSIWEETSYYLERQQMNVLLAEEEYRSLKIRKTPSYRYDLSFDIEINRFTQAIKVAVIREEGSNGDREMVAALNMAGFEVWDVVMEDLLREKITIDQFRGIICPGGFSYADVLGSAKGWAASLIFNPVLYDQFDVFYKSEDKFSLGICNGCQLMALLGWINVNIDDDCAENESQLNADIVLKQNDSGRFESRFSTVRILESNSIMLRGMENSVLGVWVAHAEGKFEFRDDYVRSHLEENNCIPVKYIDDNGIPTENYPFNPNGSADGIAGICSKDGRHLAMMPHPERCIQFWQWPYVPPEWNSYSQSMSPWFQMFVNAYEWCCNDESDTNDG